MHNSEAILPDQQLGWTLHAFSIQPPKCEGDVHRTQAPSLVPISTLVTSGEVPLLETIPIEFIGRKLTDTNGESFLGWVYEGALYVDDGDLREVPGGVDGLPVWLAAAITNGWGSHSEARCVRVKVHSREGNSVHVTAEIRV